MGRKVDDAARARIAQRLRPRRVRVQRTSAHRADPDREALHIIDRELELVAEFVRQLPPLAAMDLASHLGLIKRTLAGLK